MREVNLGKMKGFWMMAFSSTQAPFSERKGFDNLVFLEFEVDSRAQSY